MIECSSGGEWFHAECLNMSSHGEPWNDTGFWWDCPSCDTMPHAKKDKPLETKAEFMQRTTDSSLVSVPPGLLLIPYGLMLNQNGENCQIVDNSHH
uniref:Zinc finger PHD-type domain-containing protein n=1 Tax=Romanomermis culicivorax TaxID=13658 RepID=A0A915HSQ3_ROMCU